MPRTTCSFVVAVLLSVACAAGCRFPDFMRYRNSPQNSDSTDNQRLSKRQVTEVQLSLAHSLEKQGDDLAALDAYREAAANEPRGATAPWRMAVIHDRQGNFAEAEANYRRALKASPKDPEIHCDYGYSLYLQRRWAESEEHLRQALLLNQGHRRAHNNMGLLLAQTERFDEALAQFRLAGCPEAESRANLAFVLTLNHRWDEARGQYELALQANPESPAAKAGMETLRGIVAKAKPGAALTQVGYEHPTFSSEETPAGARIEVTRPGRPDHSSPWAAR